FGQNLREIVSDMMDVLDKPISELSLMSSRAHQFYVNDLNQIKTDAPLEKSIIELFEKTVQAYGDKNATCCDGDVLTYHELNTYVTTYALEIQRQQINNGTPIVMLLERGPEQIISMLAILRAGCIYIPIDPMSPEERIQYILDDSGAEIVITNQQNEDVINKPIHVLYLEHMPTSDTHAKTSEHISSSYERVTGEDPAYIMYTSGSTGKPKGTVIRQKSITRVVKGTNYIDITPSDKLLQLSNYSFDGSTFDIYGALLNGAGLVMVPEETVIEMSNLAQLIEEEKITVFFITTALFNVLIDWDATCLRNVRKILFGGEETSIQHVQKAFRVLGPNRLVNVYGPTESTVFATFYPIDSCDEGTEIIPIGYPISNTTLYVLDEHGHHVPPNIPGELYIGGDGVAEEYLNRQELTEAKFVRFSDDHDERVYRTGDLVWRNPSGAICFLGRTDFQVKIRGFRVELGEIENRIRDIRGIKEVIVVTKKDKTDS